MKKAIVYGASGLVGSYILETLLNSPDYEQIIAVVRKDLNIRHAKLLTLAGDFSSLPDLTKGIAVDEVYIALGTTRKKTPDQKEYYRIDHDYPVLAAKSAKENGAKTVLLVSSIGANTKSKAFYTRTKGETEQDLINLDFDHTCIFRPSLILGNRKEKRIIEKSFMAVWKVINPVLSGKMNKYKGIEAKNMARAMVGAANHPDGKVKIFYWKEMMDLQS